MPQLNDNGLIVRTVRPAPKGLLVKSGDLLGVFYLGTFLDGTVFDKNFVFNGFRQVGDLLTFTLGNSEVIQGWELAFEGRRVGEIFDIQVPPELGYGYQDYGGIPGGSTLNFRVMLIGAIPAGQQAATYFSLADLGLKRADLGVPFGLLSGAPTTIDSGQFVVGTPLPDKLTGFFEDELMIGLRGNDIIGGGAGADLQVGGLGADVFIYYELSDSLPGKADRIADFKGKAGDRLDLSRVDADSLGSGDQNFRYIGSAPYGGVAGELRYQNGVLSGDVNADKQTDFEVQLIGAPRLLVGNLVL